jgi:integrase
MASISTDPNGNRRIFFKLPNGKRDKIHLGDVSLKWAESFKGRLKSILEDKALNRRHDDDLLSWIRNIDDTLHKKLAAKGLVSPRDKPELSTLGPFIDGYIALRSDIKPGTKVNLIRCRREIVDYFGENKPLADVTEGDADEFRLALRKRLAENTTRRICGRARQFFHAAIKRRLITANPFASMKAISVMANKSREYFINRADAEKVLASCPDSQWRLLFALSRFGGLRCPSEHLALRWSDIHWDIGRMTIHSSKTEHHEGKAERIIPIFPEVLPYLQAVQDEANPGIDCAFSDPVITRYREQNSNLRTQLNRIIGRAGLTPWPKLFQNLRSTRQTELAEIFPAHVVCYFMGNSEAVAKKHYLQVTDEHYQKAAHITAQTGANRPGLEETEATEKSKKCYTVSNSPQWSDQTMTPTGLEPVLPA